MIRSQHAGLHTSGGLSLNVFTDAELDEIHLATLEVLERAGIYCDDPEALAIFADGGCAVHRETGMVTFPGHVVEAAIASAPASFAGYGRDAAFDVLFEPGRVGFTTFGEGLKVVDPETGELRASTRQDVADTARLTDYLDGIDAYEVAVGASDVAPEMAEIHNYAAAVGDCRKHICACPIGGWEAKQVIAIAAAVAGGRDELRARPIVTLGMCPVSPLKLPRECSEVIVAAARAGLPANILSMAMAGASSPITLAGTLVTHNAEVLSGIVLSQLTERGAKVFYGSSTTAMDLRLAAASVGSPECAMINAGVACLARRYRLPSYVAGLQGDSKLGDAQTGHEHTLTALLPALAGASLIYGAGMIESGVTFDCAQLVLDAEIAQMVKRTVSGIPVSDETLAVDDIIGVGSFGDFLSLDATLRHMRDHSQPELLDRRVREDWVTAGSSDLYARARAKALGILSEHHPEPLSAEVAARIGRVIRDAEAELASASNLAD